MTGLEEWTPKSIQCLRTYTWATFAKDLVAGFTVGLVALPLAMAFAISSGVPPQNGIYCAVIAGFLASALGGSNCQISGPTGAFVVVVAGIVAKFGIDGLYMCTLMAGVMLMFLGITRLGSAVKFIPRPVVIGFTNGIAVLIASTQIKDFLGLEIEKVPGEFWPRMVALGNALPTISAQTATLAAIALAVLIAMARFVKRVPGAIIVLLVGTVAAFVLKLPVETIETRFGGIPAGLPKFEIPKFDPTILSSLISPALTVTMLGAIESLLSAVVADRMTGDKHNPNVELVAQGVANIASPLFGGLPATGAIARTATNIRSGGKTPMSGMIHALTLLGVLLFAAPLAKFIPLCVLSAILFMVAYNMGEWKEIPQILKLSKADIGVWLLTFALTVFADLTVAVEAGMILAALTYIRKVTSTTTVAKVTGDYLVEGREHVLQLQEIPEGVAIYRIHGPFLFGSTDKIAEITDNIATLPPVVILRLRNMTAIDATGIQALEDLTDVLKKNNRAVLFCGMREQPRELLLKAKFDDHVGANNLCRNVSEALGRAREILSA